MRGLFQRKPSAEERYHDGTATEEERAPPPTGGASGAAQQLSFRVVFNDQYLGMTLQEQPGTRLAAATSIAPGSEAARIGIRVGDVVEAVNGTRTPGLDHAMRGVTVSSTSCRLCTPAVYHKP